MSSTGAAGVNLEGSGLFVADTVDADRDAVRYQLSSSRERRLLLAILERAAEDSTSRINPQLRAAAQLWWLDRAREDMFSAVGICAELNLDYSYLLRGLREQWFQRQLWIPPGDRARLLQDKRRGPRPGRTTREG